MKKDTIQVYIFLAFFAAFCFYFSPVDHDGIYVARFDIYHWTKYDGGYDIIGYMDSDANIEIVSHKANRNKVEKFFKKIDFQSRAGVVHDGKVFENDDNIYFAGLEPDENAPASTPVFYVLFFDNFTKAVSNAGPDMDNFDINKPDSWQLTEYYYIIENPDFVKQFFAENGALQ